MLTQMEILKLAKELESTPETVCKIVDVCEKYDLDIKGNVFKQSPENIESICITLLQHNLKPNTHRMAFEKKPETVEKIIEVCEQNKIPVEPHIFRKKPQELTDCINWIRANYGNYYVLAHTVMTDLDKLKESMPTLQTLGLLLYSRQDPAIFSLSRDEIIERTGILTYLGLPLHHVNRVSQLDRIHRAFTFSSKSFDDFCYINGMHEPQRKLCKDRIEKLIRDFEANKSKKSVK